MPTSCLSALHIILTYLISAKKLSSPSKGSHSLLYCREYFLPSKLVAKETVEGLQIHRLSFVCNHVLLQVNPLVGNILEAYSKSSTAVSLPRQQRPSLVESDTVAGISAFAFQGTNAHAILSAPDPTRTSYRDFAPLTFVRKRMWFASVSPHRMLQTAAVSSGKPQTDILLFL